MTEIKVQPKSGTPEYYKHKGIDPNTYTEMVLAGRDNLTPYEGYLIGQLIKYVSRYKAKETSKDGEKILYYAELLAEQEMKQEDA